MILMKKVSIGAENQVRTGDPSLFRGMLYQLSYLGDCASRVFVATWDSATKTHDTPLQTIGIKIRGTS